jgi:hypothetical protein
MKRATHLRLISCILVVAIGGAVAGADVPNSNQVAREVDRLLSEEVLSAAPSAPADLVDDETFLRRIYLDLVGASPSPEEVTRFALDPASDKRSMTVERLLSDPRFGANWARYWRDVIMYRRADDRALLSSGALTEYLTQALNENKPWDEIASSFITATGNVAENGQTALIMAQMGQAEDVAAEVSRIFMGVQIQCAQCHDHPTDRWKREQFHELAAFFPRIAVRPIRVDGQQRGFEVVSAERGGRRPGGQARGAGGEHFMPDMQDASARGTLMQPVLFATSEKLPAGQNDQERRDALADWVTGASNPWFAQAFVNRLWAELVGEGFYEPVDDLGPDRTPTAPRTIERLSTAFVDTGYDVRRLFQTIMATAAYQRESRPRRTSDELPFLASCPQRLRGDQLYESLKGALGIAEPPVPSAPGPMGLAARARSPRGQFLQVFGYDPSEAREEVAGTIPQALLLINSRVVGQAINGKSPRSQLGRLLSDTPDDEDVVVELYLRVLSRQPVDEELSTCLDYVKETNDRAEAFEDILWSLVNSTEFLYRK